MQFLNRELTLDPYMSIYSSIGDSNLYARYLVIEKINKASWFSFDSFQAFKRNLFKSLT